jgi:hypothetical protein
VGSCRYLDAAKQKKKDLKAARKNGTAPKKEKKRSKKDQVHRS